MQKHSVLRPLGSPELPKRQGSTPRTALLSVRVPSVLHIGFARLPRFRRRFAHAATSRPAGLIISP